MSHQVLEKSAPPHPEETSLDEEKDLAVPGEHTENIDTIALDDTPRQKTSNIFAIIAAGSGLLSDGYQNSLLQTSNVLFRKIYGTNVYVSRWSTQIANALLVGTVLGMITFGFITDRIGRKAAIVGTTCFIILGGILGVVAHAPTPQGFFWFLTIARGVVGFGAGGEYPSTATASIEGADAHFSKSRSLPYLMSTSWMVSSGALLSYCFCLIGLAASRYDNSRTPSELRKLEITWRCEWTVGVLLPLLVLYFRIKTFNSALYRRSAIKRRVPYWLFFKKYYPKLFGVGMSWFILQFVGYPASTFSGIILGNVNPKSTTIKTVEWTFLLTTLALPGTIIGSFAAMKMNRKYQLMTGFLGYTVLGFIIAFTYEKITKIIPLFVVLYGLFLTVGNFGPGNLNGLIAVEAFPTSMRGTSYGLIAAFGKIGGLTGTYAFSPISQRYGNKYTFILGACLGVLAATTSYLFVDDNSKIELAQRDEEWREYLAANGWDGDMGDGSEGMRTASENKFVAVRE